MSFLSKQATYELCMHSSHRCHRYVRTNFEGVSLDGWTREQTREYDVDRDGQIAQDIPISNLRSKQEEQEQEQEQEQGEEGGGQRLCQIMMTRDGQVTQQVTISNLNEKNWAGKHGARRSTLW